MPALPSLVYVLQVAEPSRGAGGGVEGALGQLGAVAVQCSASLIPSG